MPALLKTDHMAKITWLGIVPDRDTPEITCHARETMVLDWSGSADDIHSGVTRPSCSRVLAQYPRGTEIRNTRQLSIVSAAELAEIAEILALDVIDPAWLGASIVVDGIADFSHLPPSSRLQSEAGVTLTVDLQNRPCHLPAKTIAKARPGQGQAFKSAAEGRRGVTAWVERPGTLRLGDTLRLHVPDQRAWTSGASAEAPATPS